VAAITVTNPSIKAVIFDLDGVLVDACEIYYESLNAALKEITGYKISRADHETIYNGLPTRVKLTELSINKFINISDISSIIDLKQKLTLENIKAIVTVDTSKVALMEYLLSRNLKIGCYTNAVRASAELMLKLCGIREYIMVLLTNEDVERCKPDPSGYRLAFELLHVQPEETLVVEDSPKGTEAAVRSGAVVLAVKSAKDVNMSLFKGVIC